MFLSLLALSLAADDYSYQPIGKRDPFQGLVAPPRPNDSLSDWSLSATASSEEGAWALVVDRSGSSTVLQVGDYVPGSWAKVRRIDAEEVLLEEEYLDVLGELVVMRYRLKLESR